MLADEALGKQKGHRFRWPFRLFSLCRCGAGGSQVRASIKFFEQDAQNGITARPQANKKATCTR